MKYQSLRRSWSKATKLVLRTGKAALALQTYARKLAEPQTTPAKPRRGADKKLVRSAPDKALKARLFGSPKAAPPRRGSFKLSRFSGEQGKRSYMLYIPAPTAPSAGSRPLLVMLHGCTQSPADFATGTGMNGLADEFGIIVAYPTQPRSANRNKCWNWYRATDQARDAGEPALIAGIAQQVLRDHGGDAGRVYIAGFSAGGAAAAIVASAYPDVFAAVGVHSGLPIGAARGGLSALVAMRAGSAGQQQSVAMPTIIFHGDDDDVVHPRNGRAVAARAVATFPNLTQTVRKGRAGGNNSYLKNTHRAPNRKSYCEYWAIGGTGHAWSGGNPLGSYTKSTGPDASREMMRFFLQHRLSGAVES